MNILRYMCTRYSWIVSRGFGFDVRSLMRFSLPESPPLSFMCQKYVIVLLYDAVNI